MIRDLDIALVGASAVSHGRVLRDLSHAASKHRIGTPFSFSFGGFAAACDYVKTRSMLDLIHIGNNTCLAHSDLTDGCAKLAKILQSHVNRPAVVIDQALVNYSLVFTQHRITLIGNDLIAAVIQIQEARHNERRRA